MLQNKFEPRDYLIQGCERPWEVNVEPFLVAPHVYYVGNSWVGAYLIDSEDGLILIDTTMHSQVYLVFESIRKLGFDPKNIKLILLSHGHYDHCGGVRPILEYTNAKLYMGKEDAYFLNERPDLIFCEGYPFGKFIPDYFYEDNKTIQLGNINIHTIHSPGHTPGTTSFFFDVIDNKNVSYRCGMHGGIGLNTLTDKELKYSGWPISIRQDYLNTLERFKHIKIDITLGSHPNQVNMLEKVKKITENYNPFFDDTIWPHLMETRILAMQELLQHSKL